MLKSLKLFVSIIATMVLCLVATPAFAGTWEYTESTDELTDETEGYATYQDGDREIGVFCSGSTPVVMGTGSDHLGIEQEISGAYRFRGEEDTGVVDYRFITGSDGELFRFQLQDGPQIVEYLAQSTELVVRVWDYRDRQQTYTYGLDGSRNALQQLECITFADDGTLSSHDTGEDGSQWVLTEDGERAMNFFSESVSMSISCPHIMVVVQDQRLELPSEDETIGAVGFMADEQELDTFAYTLDYSHAQRAVVLDDEEKFEELLDVLWQSEEIGFLFADIRDERHSYTFDLTGSEETLPELECIDGPEETVSDESGDGEPDNDESDADESDADESDADESDADESDADESDLDKSDIVESNADESDSVDDGVKSD